MLGSEALSWASIMWAWNSRPPSEHIVGPRWRQMWLDRVKRTTPWINRWLSHQLRDKYWQHGSVCMDYSRVTIPVYMIGGWVVRSCGTRRAFVLGNAHARDIISLRRTGTATLCSARLPACPTLRVAR